MFKKVDPKMSFPKMEEEILQFWDEQKIFEKSVANREGAKRYSFYDGPPFATGTPHYGHIVASAIKDTVPRYFTMKGFQVERKWGWDCHGLPIENIAEKELGITRKKEIESLGVEKFNETCRSKVLEYVAEWKKVIRRFGRWADMENAYKTMDRDYMESVWWVFKDLWDKGLIYESYRAMHICPRCETTLSQSEVAEGYKMVKDFSVVVKFELVDKPNTFLLAWTTTPWTLPGNVALAVGKDIEYVVIEIEYFENKNKERYVIAWNRLDNIAEKLGFTEDMNSWIALKNGRTSSVILNNQKMIKFAHVINGSELVNKEYKPLFDYYSKDEKLKNRENGWKVYAADFVTTGEGTGVVHIAPAFGEDDMELGKKENLPFVQHVKMDGTMKDEVTDFAEMPVKPKENPQATDVEIIKYLAHSGKLFSKEKYEHSYPHCWRCDTPLLNYATSSWFVNVTKIKERALELAKNINWSPSHLKEGRFGKWMENARDWSISRQRYWASVMPIWKCDGLAEIKNQKSKIKTTNQNSKICENIMVFGSVKELEEVSGKKITDLHKHIVDEITFPCEKCGGVMQRVPDVLDTWFDSGSMPYAQAHYPFENKEKFEQSFPADFIGEGVDQTRAWFYYLHIIATAIQDSHAFRNVIVNGTVVAEDGRKMSKRLKNYPDPMDIINKYGADVLRYYLLSSPVVAAEDIAFSERELTDISRNMFRMLWNSYSFFTMYAAIDNWEPKEGAEASENILDKWILSELQLLTKEVSIAMEGYELSKATRTFMPFIDNLSNWYIRRSRKRFWKSEDDGDKENAYQTLYNVLETLSKLMAPFTPFLSEEIYRNLHSCHSERVCESRNLARDPSAPSQSSVGRDDNSISVHLADWPTADEKMIDEKLNKEMYEVRNLVTLGLKLRAEAKIKVRQPIASLKIKNQKSKIKNELTGIIKDEVNVKEIIFDDSIKEDVVLDTNITLALKLEGEAREIIRAIQEGRKKAGFNVEDRIVLGYKGKEMVFKGGIKNELKGFEEEIAKEILATSVENSELADAEYRESVKIEGEEFLFSLKRV